MSVYLNTVKFYFDVVAAPIGGEINEPCDSRVPSKPVHRFLLIVAQLNTVGDLFSPQSREFRVVHVARAYLKLAKQEFKTRQY
jgi:hypothetical protein